MSKLEEMARQSYEASRGRLKLKFQCDLPPWEELERHEQREAVADMRQALLSLGEADEGMVKRFLDTDTPFISRRNKEYDDGRIYEIVRMNNADWREVIRDDQTVIARYPNSKEADEHCARLQAEWRWAALIDHVLKEGGE